jgi:hypothetical protein
MSCGTTISRTLWWLANISAQMLESVEREAVRGDLAESGETGGQALRHVVGLVIRRQASIWTDWRPWVTLAGLVVPLGMLLSIISRRTATISAVYIWMYANNWDWNLFGYRAFWYQFANTAVETFTTFLALGCVSWTSGFLLGSASGRTVRVNGLLFCLMLAFGELLGAPIYFTYYGHYLQRAIGLPLAAHQPHDPVGALTFYRVVFPLIVQAGLVLLPSLWGMREGARAVRFRLLLRTILWTVAIATLVAVVIQNPDMWWFLMLYRRPGIWWQGRQGHILQLFAYWPLVFMLSTAITRRLHGGRVVSHSPLP